MYHKIRTQTRAVFDNATCVPGPEMVTFAKEMLALSQELLENTTEDNLQVVYTQEEFATAVACAKERDAILYAAVRDLPPPNAVAGPSSAPVAPPPTPTPATVPQQAEVATSGGADAMEIGT